MTTVSADPPAEFASKSWSNDPDGGWAVFGHIGASFSGIFAPGLALMIAGRRSEYVRQHVRQSLNFQLNCVLTLIALQVLDGATGTSTGIIRLIILGFGFVWPFVAATKVRKGIWNPYPQLVPLLRSLPEPLR